MAADDQRAAVGFSITLSGQLIAASTATLAVVCAYVSYALGNRTPPWYFYVCVLSAAFLIVFSIFKGGKGIVKARNAGFGARWSLEDGKNEFNVQAISLIGALLLLGIGFLSSGPIKEQKLDQKLENVCQAIGALQAEVGSHRTLDSTAQAMQQELNGIRQEIHGLRTSIEQSKATPIPKDKRH
jgi:hypothetical protein